MEREPCVRSREHGFWRTRRLGIDAPQATPALRIGYFVVLAVMSIQGAVW